MDELERLIEDLEDLMLPDHAVKRTLDYLKKELIAPTRDGDDGWKCGKCGGTVGWYTYGHCEGDATKFDYCPNCGKAVKW